MLRTICCARRLDRSKIGAPADIAIGISDGVLGGLTGLGGIISTISCQFRSWSKDKQRAVFQPVLFAAFVIIAISQFVAGSYGAPDSSGADTYVLCEINVSSCFAIPDSAPEIIARTVRERLSRQS